MYLDYISENVAVDIMGEPVPPNVLWIEEGIRHLETHALEYTHEELAEFIEVLTEEYYERFEVLPSKEMLYRLTNVFLASDLRSKIKTVDILSDRQLEMRRTGRSARKNSKKREVSLNAAATVASDGINYALPKRRFRT